ncbi:hypothetical protein Acr_23g0011140 [Actinidia rufa]|uniref:Uncharacterized protein n=1 Tax=Actinidia rufa TaxID=165716 RepID=A0A7J0GPK1_9ERIC|nr:hypothetical protein Acr_23g0011140 [Actinidia rufa]
MPYSAPQAPPPVPQHAQYQPPHRRNEDHETRTKVTNLEQSFMNFEKHMGKVNSILESLVISQQMQGRFPAQPQQNPKPTNCIEKHMSKSRPSRLLEVVRKLIKTIAPKRVIQGGEKSKELGVEKCDSPIAKTVPKYKDPGCPTISCIIGGCKIDRALLDLGSSVNLLPYSVYKDLVDTVYYPVDFIVLDTQPVDCESSKCHIPVILGRPFLATANAVIHCRHGLLKLSFGNMTLETNIFTVSKQMKEVDQQLCSKT